MSDALEEQIREFVSAQAQGVPVADDEDIFASGLANSLFAVQLVGWVEHTFGLTLDGRDLVLGNFATVSAIAALVAGKRTGQEVRHGL